MYLKELKLWNFRKYGTSEDNPGLTVQFKQGLNLLVGENDSGKTAIIDAIRLILGTQSNDYQRLKEEDFFKPINGKRTTELKVECVFSKFSPKEAASFLEWLSFDNNGGYELQIRLKAKMIENRIITDIKAGIEGADIQLDGSARELLRVTYLKPLRDAENELTPGYRSRLAQILKSHELFQVKKDEEHPLVQYIKDANSQINSYFTEDKILLKDTSKSVTSGKKISESLNEFLKEFFSQDDQTKARFNIGDVELTDVLRKLSLIIDDNKSGLGSLNLLFIATELLLFQNNKHYGLKLALVEEIEAHLHPQAQLRLIDFLQKAETKGQFILTSHSTTLASTINLKNLIVCSSNQTFPMGPAFTKLAEEDYSFLERFLDATKSNLFFARGVILVEGDAENLLLPTIAEIIEKPLHKYGISIVNVGSTAFLRFAKIFLRNDQKKMNIPVAVITDLDVRPIEYYIDKNATKDVYCVNDSNIEQLKELNNEIDFEKIKGDIFESKTSFEDALKMVYTKKRFPNGFKEKCIYIAKFEVSVNSIKTIRLNKSQHKKKYFSEGDIQAFISSKWTLEYDLALSDLRDYIFKAIIAAKMEKNNAIVVTDEMFNKVIDEEVRYYYHNWEQEAYSNEKIAYEIYKGLLNGQASKATTAQYLAKLLIKDKEEVTQIIRTDENLKYLAQAIEYVTKRRE